MNWAPCEAWQIGSAKLFMDPHPQTRRFSNSEKFQMQSTVEWRTSWSIYRNRALQSLTFIQTWLWSLFHFWKQMAVLHMQDYKLTFRQASNLEAYPLPRVEDLFASQAGVSPFNLFITCCGRTRTTPRLHVHFGPSWAICFWWSFMPLIHWQYQLNLPRLSVPWLGLVPGMSCFHLE